MAGILASVVVPNFLRPPARKISPKVLVRVLPLWSVLLFDLHACLYLLNVHRVVLLW
jgi:hypothetical protein